MEETTFVADPMRLMIAAAAGIVVLLVLIIKFKLHPVLSMMISAIIIGAGAGMPLTMISDTVEKGVGKTLQGIALLVGLGSKFGGILEVSGGAQRIAETLIGKFGQKKAGWALGLTGLVIGTTVFFEAGVGTDSAGVQCCKADQKIHFVLCNPPSFRSGQWLCICSTICRLRTCGKCTWSKSGNHDYGRSSDSTDLYAGFRNYLGKRGWKQDFHRTSGECRRNQG